MRPQQDKEAKYDNGSNHLSAGAQDNHLFLLIVHQLFLTMP